jgi:SAM-dependent methyltransferase
MSHALHSGLQPSEWVRRWSSLVTAPALVLDVACGSGRHLCWFAARGDRVTGVDRDSAAVNGLRDQGEIIVADIENGPWPLAGRRFDAVVVTNYLWRPLMPSILDALDDGGVLIYETFAVGNEAFGKPSNPHFLLRPGELLDLAASLRIVAYEEGVLESPARCVQRLAAMRGGPPAKIAVP